MPAPAPTPTTTRWHCLPLALVVLAYAGLTAVLMGTIGLREPFSDQWRQQVPLLEGSLPASLFKLENGHRQVLPNLVRLADLRWTDGGGEVLAWTGVLLFVATLLLWAHLVRRRGATDALPAWLAVAGLALGIGFLAQGRMLLHPSESIQVGGVYLGTLLAVACTLQEPGWRPLTGALLAASMATFCFGTGLAAYGAVLVLLVLQRRPGRQLVMAALAAGCVAYAYRCLLPAGDELAEATRLSPLGLALDLPRWLGAPFVQAFFGLADPAFQGGIAAAVQGRWPLGDAWLALAGAASAPLGVGRTLDFASAALGSVGLFALGTASHRTWVAARRGELSTAGPLRRLGLGLAWFAVGAGVLVCVARTDYFQNQPEQVFAERYLVWSCLFWSGLWVCFVAASDSPRRQRWGTAALVLAALLLWPVQRAWISWGIATRTEVERTALALRLGIDDPAVAAPAIDLGEYSFARCVQPVRAQRLQMFAEPAGPALGERLAWAGPPAAPSALPTLAAPLRVALPDGRTFGCGSQQLPPGLLAATGREWPIVDDLGVVVGRVRADTSCQLARRLPQPLVSQAGNCYVLGSATGGRAFVVDGEPPHATLAVVARPRLP